MTEQSKYQATATVARTSTKRYWRRLERRAGWGLAGWWPLAGLLALFAYGAIETAPAMQGEIAEQVHAVLSATGVQGLSVEADGQAVLVQARGAEADEDRIVALASSAACDTWIGGALVCPTSVRVELIGPPEDLPAVFTPRFHNFRFLKLDDTLVLNGEVPSQSLLNAIVAAARSRFGPVTDELTVSADMATSGFDWAVDRAWPALALISSGEVRWQDGAFSVDGNATAESEADLRQAFATSAYPERLGELRLAEIAVADRCESQFAALLGNATIEFRTASAEISAASRALIEELAEIARRCAVPLIIEGHTDSAGSAETNRALSLARAEEVLGALTALGVEASRLSARGLGASRPIADNSTASGRARNRRIEIHVSEDVGGSDP